MEWIDATKCLPKEDVNVIVASKENGTYVSTAEYIHSEKRWYMYGDYYNSSIEVDYWMEIPELPDNLLIPDLNAER